MYRRITSACTHCALLALVVVLTAALFPLAAHADQYSSYDYVSAVTVGSTGTLYVYMQGGSYVNPVPCTSATRYTVHPDHPAFKEIYSMLMAALVSQSRIRFEISGTECWGNNPKIKLATMSAS